MTWRKAVLSLAAFAVIGITAGCEYYEPHVYTYRHRYYDYYDRGPVAYHYRYYSHERPDRYAYRTPVYVYRDYRYKHCPDRYASSRWNYYR